jgi:hypothetical protein
MRANLLTKLHFVILFPLVLLGSTLFAMTRPAVAADTSPGPAVFQSAAIMDAQAHNPINSNGRAGLMPARQITQTTWPAYGPATVLLEDQAGFVSELSPAYANSGFSAFYILNEGNSYTLWLGSILNTNGDDYDSIEQRFESQDGVVWRNRTNTNLALSSTYWSQLGGLRNVVKDGPLYEGWERYFYNVISGWWAQNTRYVTSTSGITWTVANQAPMETTNYPSLIKEGGIYHIWANPDVDSRYDPDKRLRYRTSSSGGSGWGHWKTGGTVINIDGNPWGLAPSRVRQGADGTYQLFTQSTSGINLATSTNGITFTTQITDLVKFSDVLSPSVSVGDFLVLDVQGEDWFYFTYGDAQGSHVAVSRPILTSLYLPIVLKNYSPLVFPLHVGDAISTRPVSYKGEMFYTTTVKVSSPLPSGGHFYLSSNPTTLTEVVVDDKIALLLGGEEIFIYNFSVSGSPQAAIVEIPRSVMGQLAGQTVRVEYRDVYGVWVEASEMWLIWLP